MPYSTPISQPRSPAVVLRITAFAGIAAVVASAACSGTTTGNGTSGGPLGGTSGGTSGTGGGTSGSTGTSGGTSGTTGTSGGMGVIPTTCSASASDTACSSCLKSSCCSQGLQCSHETECNAVFNCAATCTTQQCTNDCVAAHPSAQTTLNAFINCEEEFCGAACGGSSGSTSGSSGSSSTCSTAADQSVCAQEAGRTFAEDCPGGPPSTQCVAAPIGGINNTIYCCP